MSLLLIIIGVVLFGIALRIAFGDPKNEQLAMEIFLGVLGLVLIGTGIGQL